MTKLYGQLIALTRNVCLVPPANERASESQFMPGPRQPFSPPIGIAISWWRTKQYRKSAENIASMIVTCVDGFSGCDPETIEETIDKTLEELCADRTLFNTDAVFFRRSATLFDARRVPDATEFSSAILAALLANLRPQIADRCTVYVVPRLAGPTFHIPSLAVTFLKRDDTAAWHAITDNGYGTNGWSPDTGAFRIGDTTPFENLEYSYAIVAEENGTLKGTRLTASLKLRMALAVVFATISTRREYPLFKSAAAPYELCMQFCKPNGSSAGIVTNGLGALLPYYAEDFALVPEDIAHIQRWFAIAKALPKEHLSRLEKGAHFANRAMNSDDIESYVNYFVALDALFGVRGAVETSITSAVTALELSGRMDEKISSLFDLRNELVHGGSRYAKEWPKYERYYRHFDSDPHLDIEKLVFAALLHAPEYFSSGAFERSRSERAADPRARRQQSTEVRKTSWQALREWFAKLLVRFS
jgi:hypothetical protein